MIVFRRVISVFLTFVLMGTFGACIVIDRVAVEVFDADFIKDELISLDAYEFTTDVLYTQAVDELLTGQDDWLPANFGATEFRSEEQAQQTLVELLETIFPPDYLLQVAEHVIDEFIPYVTGETNSFEIRLDLGDRIKFALARVNGQPSPVEEAFRELNYARSIIDGAMDSVIEESEAEAARQGAGGLDVGGLIEEQIGGRDAAAEWFTEQIFTVVDDLLPYLLGQSPSFETHISFDENPALALVLAQLLEEDAAVLEAEGYTYDDRQLNETLDESNTNGTTAIDRRLEFMREDYVYTERDFLEDIAEDGTDIDDFDNTRGRVNSFRTALRFGAIAAVLGSVFTIGVMGGRRWPTRWMWGSGALLVVSALWFVTTGPVWSQFGQPEVHDALIESTDDWSDNVASVRLSFIDRVEEFADDIADGFASRAMKVFGASLVVFVLAALWAYFKYPGAGAMRSAADEPIDDSGESTESTEPGDPTEPSTATDSLENVDEGFQAPGAIPWEEPKD
jgi:hypothetical protein